MEVITCIQFSKLKEEEHYQKFKIRLQLFGETDKKKSLKGIDIERMVNETLEMFNITENFTKLKKMIKQEQKEKAEKIGEILEESEQPKEKQNKEKAINTEEFGPLEKLEPENTEEIEKEILNIQYFSSIEIILEEEIQISKKKQKQKRKLRRELKNKNKENQQDFELGDLFEETEIMATHNEVKRALEAALGLIAEDLDDALPAGDTIFGRIRRLDDRINIVETEVSTTVPKFSGRDEEDVEEWIAQVEALFTASGRQPGVNNANIAQYAKGGLQGAALR